MCYALAIWNVIFARETVFDDMKPFLRQVAEHYYNKGGIEELCFIFPNRRSMVFFRKWLAETVSGTDRPIIVPRMLTINDFFAKVSGLRTADRLRLLLDLYDCYAVLNPHAESVDEFVFWGDVILSDFNDVDKYLVDPRQLFTNIADYKQLQDTFSYLSDTQRKAVESFISHFNDQSGRLVVNLDTDDPDVKGRFLQIWNILYPLYESFNRLLKGKGSAYEGMAYRELAERFKASPVEDVLDGDFADVRSFVFVGLNALNECEKTVLRRLRDASKAEFCWDWSGELIKDEQNRSSVFMSENVLEFPQASQWDEEGVSIPEINVVSVSSSVGQAKRLPDILSKIKNPQADCAVVLPDENLLVPVLNTIPLDIRDINVTMGLPMTGSLFYDMMTHVASVQMHAVCKRGQWFFYHKPVWDLFSNDVFRNAADERSREIMSRVRKEAGYYIPLENLNGTPLMDAVFRVVVTDTKSNAAAQVSDLADHLMNAVRVIAPLVSADAAMAVELEFAKEYHKGLTMIKDCLLASGKQRDMLPGTFLRLLSQMLGTVSVPFRGEPLKGLQIMGPLEMRSLDFRNLVIMSANEGVFPRRSVSSSFIPPELRKGFSLPTYEYQDAIWAYYFYRMISRAEKVWMLVDSRTEGLKSGEESRYIKQLEYHFGIPLNRYVVKFAGMKTAELPDITKTDEDIAIIKEKEHSATSLQNYLACPAKFYYGTVKGLKAEEEVAESLDYGMFGTVYHDTMRSLYTSEEAMSPDFHFDHKGENEKMLGSRLTHVTRAYIKGWLGRENEIRIKVKALIAAQLNTLEVSGRNLVVTDVIVRYVVKTLQRDLELLEKAGRDSFEILGREIKMKGSFHGLKLKGFIDRLDSFDAGQARVVDYKTGKVLDDDVDIHDGNAEAIAENIFAPDVKDRPKIAFQFFIYDYLVRQHPQVEGKDIFNCVYSTSKIFREAPVTMPMNRKFFDAVSGHLEKMVGEMCDPDVGFRRTQDEKICGFCDFRTICGR